MKTKVNNKGELSSRCVGLGAIMALVLGFSGVVSSVNAGEITAIHIADGSENSVDGIGEFSDFFDVDLVDDTAITIDFSGASATEGFHIFLANTQTLTDIRLIWTQDNINITGAPTTAGALDLSGSSPGGLGQLAVTSFSTVDSFEVLLDFSAGAGFGSGQDLDIGEIFWTSFNTTDDYSLTIDANGLDALAPVPLPAAAWLFISGLMGLGAVSRRK